MRTDLSPIKIRMLVSLLLICVLSGVGPATAVEVGDQAPDFSLKSTTGEEISLSQFKGKQNVLIQFYTMDFNPT